MSIQKITEHLEKLYQLNESLLTLSKQKTELVKKSKIDEFNELLMKERKHAQAIEQVEAKRVELTDEWFMKHAPNTSEKTLSQMIELVEGEAEKEKLQTVYENLIVNLADLKQQEALNQDLIQQSLQFIELSMEMFQPNSKNMNYDKPKGQQGKSSSQSVFDSKA
ncbi:flagellar protein FlgN [Filobacillus milosensis]|uniref:Flagellar protein FlgN n=1 Tax=Filobacillus milosensis TaxID=94137 RepID=A0A4Y8IRF3_9BACI|nr:flagellar protein FlgN [Filobacillus milosensis]TFB24381.1 flagellar protein FlgN [Filobacillus milosensis]